MPYDYTLSIGLNTPTHVVVGYDLYVLIDMELVEGPTDLVNLSVSGLPAGATASWPDLEAFCCGPGLAINPNTDIVVKIAVGSGVTPGDYTVTVSAESDGVEREDSFTLTVEPVPDDLPFTPISSYPAIPSLATWESNMTFWGDDNCGDPDTYYDAMRVYHNIKRYTGSTDWDTCIASAKTTYRDDFVLANNGSVSGFWNFTYGCRLDYERTGDLDSKEAVVLLSQNSSFCFEIPVWNMIPATISRETSYAICAYINAWKVGESQSTRLLPYVNILLGMFDQWFVNMSVRPPESFVIEGARGNYYIQPFMVGLAFESLIQYYEEVTPDPRIPYYIKLACDWLWTHAWDEEYQAFWYENWIEDPGDIPAGFWETVGEQPTSNADDLNLLIAPAFAWLWRKTGDSTYQERGDAIFAGGVAGAYLAGGKQFNQNYRWSFDYVTWRTPAIRRVGKVKRKRSS